jgi:DNA-3-methyladenine glycosylase II
MCQAMTRNTFTLEPIPPFRLDLTAWTLRRRADNAVDRWDGASYRRVLVLPGGPAEVAVTQSGSSARPRLRVAVTGAGGRGAKAAVTAALERLLGLRTNLATFYRFAAGQPKLGELARRFRGMKPPRFPTVFECLVNGIACQQVTLTLGLRLLNRVAEKYAPAAGTAEPAAHAFPRPEDLAGGTPEELRPLGFSRQKARAMIELARGVARGELDLEGLAGLDDETALARLRELRGIGRWTAEYALLRGLGRLHVFPGDDVGGQRNLQRWLRRSDRLDYEGVRRTLARWRRYGGLVYFHLLLDRLAEAGHVQGAPVPPRRGRQ